MKTTILALLGFATLANSGMAQTPAPAPQSAPTAVASSPASSPADPSVGTPKKDDGTFLRKHEAIMRKAKSGPIGLLFLGDSITENWKSRAPELWKQYEEKYQAADFGIGGDQTQHVIWRIEQGELDGIHPKVVVFMLGTNNTAAYTADQIAAADRKIIRMIREKLPEAKIVLMAILPRGPRTGDKQVGYEHRMETIRAVNLQLAKLDDGKTIHYLDIGPKFIDADGKIPETLMPDQLHPSAAGYKFWVDALQPLLDEMMR
jgi:lysophospholipase L1-like esterase